MPCSGEGGRLKGEVELAEVNAEPAELENQSPQEKKKTTNIFKAVRQYIYIYIVLRLSVHILYFQFTYATGLDYLFLLTGTACAVLHGAAFPVAMFIFGFITTAFTNHAASRSVASSDQFQPLTNGSVDCQQLLPGLNVTLEEAVRQLISDNTECLSDEEFISEINIQVIYFCIIAAGAFLFGVLQVVLFQLAAARQRHCIQLKLYHSLLRQDMAWFDFRDGASSVSQMEE